MPISGSAPNKSFARTNGTYSGPTTWQQTEAATVGIRSLDQDTHDEDVATALNAMLMKDGGNQATADIPMNGFSLTGLAAGAADGESVRFEQLKGLLGVSMVNGYLTASVGAGALTISVKTLAGNDPSSTDVVILSFRSSTLATGAPVICALTSATSIIVPSGATLGAADGKAFRVYVTAHNSTGTTAVLGVIKDPANTSLDETGRLSTTTIGTGSDSSDVCYTASGLTSKAFRVLGYMEWSSGLTTAGTWDAVPTTISTERPASQLSGAGAPGMFLLESGTVSNQATKDIVLTGYTRFRAIKFVLSGLRPATDAVELYARFSTNGGSSWISSGYNYAGTETIDGATTAAFGSGSASVIKLTSAASGGIGNGSNEGYNGEIELFNQTSGSFWPRIMFRGYHIDSAGTPGGHYTSGGGSNETAQDVDGLQLFVDTGNIAAMNYALYGYI